MEEAVERIKAFRSLSTMFSRANTADSVTLKVKNQTEDGKRTLDLQTTKSENISPTLPMQSLTFWILIKRWE